MTVSIGRFWENVALIYMMAQGYQLVAQRWKKHGAECDLIMSNGTKGIFLEIKFRETECAARYAWSKKQRLNVLKIITIWMDQFSEIEVHYMWFFKYGMQQEKLEWMDLV